MRHPVLQIEPSTLQAPRVLPIIFKHVDKNSDQIFDQSFPHFQIIHRHITSGECRLCIRSIQTQTVSELKQCIPGLTLIDLSGKKKNTTKILDMAPVKA